MTPDDFRRIALSMPEATEVYRWGIPSSGWNEELSPAWEGRGGLGSTNVLLAAAEEVMVQSAIEAAWRNVAPKPPLKRKKRADKPPRS